MTSDRRAIVLIALTSLATTTSVVGLVIAGKIHQIGPGIVVPVSMWLFPLIFVFGNITTEVYGGKLARWQVIWVYACSLLGMLYYVLAVLVPYPDYWTNQDAYRTVFLTTPRILVASAVAYVVVANVGIWVMLGVKKATEGRWLWLRIVVTAAITQTLDSLLFVGLAFGGIVPMTGLVNLMVTSSILKFGMQLIGVPLSYAIVGFVKEKI